LRQIGPIGTTAWVVVGLLLLVSGVLGGRVEVIHGQFRSGFQPLSIGVGLIAFPAVVLGWQWLRSRQVHDRLQATGALPTLVNMLVFAALVLTPLYAPALSFTSGAALVFYGASMLLAALRGYSGCEVLAVSNWILGRATRSAAWVPSTSWSVARGGNWGRFGSPSSDFVLLGSVPTPPLLGTDQSSSFSRRNSV